MALSFARRHEQEILRLFRTAVSQIRRVWKQVADDGSRRRASGGCSMAAMPKGRMGPPLRSFATDAQDCIMVRVSWPTEYKVVVRCTSRRERRTPLDVSSRPPPACRCAGAVKMRPDRERSLGKGLDRRPILTAPAGASVRDLWVGTKKRASRSNQETRNEARPAVK